MRSNEWKLTSPILPHFSNMVRNRVIPGQLKFPEILKNNLHTDRTWREPSKRSNVLATSEAIFLLVGLSSAVREGVEICKVSFLVSQ